MTLSERIKLFRAKNNLSQEKFAKLCKLDRAYINNIENKRVVPGKMAKMKIELVLDGEKINGEV
jgi:transcriptional regulator with XRE-family HTH domain